jgi:hypothetical protein
MVRLAPIIILYLSFLAFFKKSIDFDLLNIYMFKLHVISDLNYGFNEPTEPADETIPSDVDLVVFNGNLGNPKRSIFYAHNMSKKYPDVQFVYNLGTYERYWRMFTKYEYEREDNFNVRINNSNDWLPNLHWKDPRTDNGLLIKLRTGQTVDVFPVYGFPKIYSYEGSWEDTFFYQNHSICARHKDEFLEGEEKPKELAYVSYGGLPIWASMDWDNEKYNEMNLKLKRWESSLQHYGILVTHLSPYKDSRLSNCKVAPYEIHLDNRIWITSHDRVKNINYLGAKLYSNPGRGLERRSEVIELD